MKKFAVFLLLIPLIISSAQNLDSLYTEFLQVKGIKQYVRQQISGETHHPIKCGFGIVSQVKSNYDKFSAIQKKVLTSLLQRPATDTSFVSPKGWFRIHFSKTGYHAPGYDVNEAAKAADSSYNYEVNFLGYPPPLNDGTAGGDGLYDIYIQNLSDAYGYTEFDDPVTSDIYSVIDNDFGNYYHTHGIDGARVTIAHEFHHAIQIGRYIYRSNDTFYYELTSTAMEEFVYDSINDYYYYMD